MQEAFESVRNFLATVGLIVVIAIIGYASWHALYATKRYRANSKQRAEQLAKNNARTEVSSDELDEIGYEGWVPPQREV